MPTEHVNDDENGQVLIDRFQRRVSYLRISVTDRCDLRCIYCMSENMKFLPRASLLSLEEIVQIGRGFVDLGVSKIRITGRRTAAPAGHPQGVPRIGGTRRSA